MEVSYPFLRARDFVVSFTRRHLYLSVFIFLVAICLLLYLPALTAFFISDDFTYVLWLHRDIKVFLDGQMWVDWFIGGPDGYLYFRPAGHALMLLDYVSWNLNPFGYHLTNVLLHIIASFEVFTLVYLLVRDRVTAIIAALLFAILPIHAEAVSWVAARYDVLCGVFYFAGFIFYVLFRQENKIRFFLISLGAFAMALSAKEVAIPFPVVLLIYEVVYFSRQHSRIRDVAIRLVPFGLLLALNLGFRLFVTRAFGYPGTPPTLDSAWGWLGRVFLNAANPFLADINQAGQWLLLVALMLAVLRSRLRREMILSLACIFVPFITTISSGPSNRSFYVPSLGLCLVFALVLSRFVQHQNRVIQGIGVVMLVCIGSVYGVSLILLNQAFHKAGEIAETIPLQVKALYPTLPQEARLVFVGVPDQVPEGPLVYITGFPGFLPLLYQNLDLHVLKSRKFPIWLSELDKTHFFQVDHRNVSERTDLIANLEKRRQCDVVSVPSIQWVFSQDAQGWEPWNQLSEFAVRNDSLFARSEGNDPYMASPMIDVPSIAIGDVAVTMRVRSSKAEMTGKIYWLGTDQGDFSPALQMPFTVLADGEYHVYRVDLTQSNQLLLGDHILRLRLNPVDDRADIEIKAIQVYSHCSELLGDDCRCSN